MGRNCSFFSLFAVALLSTTPMLCLSGMITHLCHEDTGENCPGERGCDHEGGCGHETGCPDDPCSMKVVRNERTREQVDAVAISAALTAVAQRTIHDRRLADLPSACRGVMFEKLLPYWPSDVPLLI